MNTTNLSSPPDPADRVAAPRLPIDKSTLTPGSRRGLKRDAAKRLTARQRPQPPEVYQVVIECAGEEEQRELFDRLVREGRKLRLLVL